MGNIIPQLFVFGFLTGYLLLLVALIWWGLGIRLVAAIKIRCARLLVKAQKELPSSTWAFRPEGQQLASERRRNFHTKPAGAR